MSTLKRRSSTTEKIADVAKSFEKRIENVVTVFWDDLPSWQQDNHFIHSGYRPASASFKRSFASLGYLHNESVNIYSHLLGALLFSVIGLVLYTVIEPRYESATTSDVVAFGCFFVGAAICMGMSATFHCILNHSLPVARFGNKLDYIGIVFLIAGSFIPSIYYGFYCYPYLQKIYWTMICTIGAGCMSVSILDRFRTPAWRPYRAGMFVLMGLSAIFPILHGVRMYGHEDMRNRIGLFWLVLQGFLYILGAGLYAARWPERSWPGSFDIWGSSHQILHVLVVLAAASHLYGLVVAFDFHHGDQGFSC